MSERIRRIYLLDPQRFSPETIAVTFAKTSRSPDSFDAIAAELSDEKSAQFNEKWVVGYGHASVAEHAVLHIAIENVSRLAVEPIEGCRLASFTEKSTRYQLWDSAAFFTPPELEHNPLRREYQQVIDRLFECYQTWQTRLIEQLQNENPPREGESDSIRERRLRSAALDVARYLLPAASLANLGMTINAREMEHSLCKLLSSPLEEVRQVGMSIKEVSSASVPTLIKYASANDFISKCINEATSEEETAISDLPQADWLKLVHYDAAGVEMVLACLLCSTGRRDFDACFQQVNALSSEEKKRFLERFLAGMGEHDNLPREFEHTFYTFDLVMDQGAYYEVKRHRMMTQNPQALGAGLGYAMPNLVERAGLAEAYREVMQSARECWLKLDAWNPAVAAYVVPNAFNRRVLMSLNIREAHQFIRLRSSPNAHFAVRRVARRMAEEIVKVHPSLTNLFPARTEESWQSIEKDLFQEIRA